MPAGLIEEGLSWRSGFSPVLVVQIQTNHFFIKTSESWLANGPAYYIHCYKESYLQMLNVEGICGKG